MDGLIVDPDLPSPRPTDGPHAWAVWSAWRGDVPLLLRVIRAAAWHVANVDGEAPRCYVNVVVRDDVEQFRSPADLRDWVTPEAVRRFRAILIHVGGRETWAELAIVRELNQYVMAPAIPGVTLDVYSADPERAERVRNGTAVAVGRGGFRWALRLRRMLPRVERGAEPVWGSGPGRDDALEKRVQLRDRRALVAGPLLNQVVASGAALAIDRIVDLGVSVLVTLSVIGLVPGLLMLLAGLLPFEARMSAFNWLQGWALPAIALTDLTPGRRLLRFVGSLLSASALAAVSLAAGSALA